MKRVFLFLFLTFMLTSLTASALSLVYSASYPASGTGTLPFTNQTLSLPEFNPAWGNLTGVTMTFTDTYSNATFSVTNTSGSTQTYTVTDQISNSLTGPGITALSAWEGVIFGPTSTGAVTNGTTWNMPAQNGSKSTAVTVTGSLASFTGITNLSYTLTNASLNPVVTGGTNTTTNSTPTVATLSITYNYNAPEPATMTIAGLGLLALGFVRRRFARR